MKVSQILEITGGGLISGDHDSDIDPGKISTDSRSIKKGELFIALNGPNFCGSKFLKDAFKRGASGAIVEDVNAPLADARKVFIKV